MFARIYAIALNTFREAIRNRIIYGIIAFVVLLNLFTLYLKEMSLQEPERVVKDTGLFAISFFGSITAVVLGVSLLYNELKKRTVHTILSKPISRTEFVLGKYIGIVGTLTLLVVIFLLAHVAVLKVSGMTVDSIILRAVILHYFEILVVAAIATFFSSFTSPFLSGVFTLCVWFLGRVTPEMREAAQNPDYSGFIHYTLKGVMTVLPDMYIFSPSSRNIDGQHWTIHGKFVGWDYLGVAAGYGLLYIGAALVLAIVIFRRRDFT